MHNPRLDDMLLEFQINDAGSTVLLCLDILVPRMLSVRKRTKLKTIIGCHIRDYLPFMKRQIFALVKSQLHLNLPAEPDVVEFTDLIEQEAPLVPQPRSSADDTAFILYTSATTGKTQGRGAFSPQRIRQRAADQSVVPHIYRRHGNRGWLPAVFS